MQFPTPIRLALITQPAAAATLAIDELARSIALSEKAESVVLPSSEFIDSHSCDEFICWLQPRTDQDLANSALKMIFQRLQREFKKLSSRRYDAKWSSSNHVTVWNEIHGLPLEQHPAKVWIICFSTKVMRSDVEAWNLVLKHTGKDQDKERMIVH